MELIIRDAQDADLPVILEIINDEILYSTSVYDKNPRTLDDQKLWFLKKQELNFPVLVAEFNGELIAYASYGTFRAFDGYRFSVEHSIYVKKAHRSNGAGKELMKALIERAIASSYHTMIAGVDSSNAKSIEFHKNFGFKEIGTIKEVAYKFDKWLDLVFLQLLLKPE